MRLGILTGGGDSVVREGPRPVDASLLETASVFFG